MNFFRGYFSLKKQKWSPDWFCPGVTPFVAPAYCNHAQEAYLKIKHNVDNCENHRWKVLKMNDNNALWRSPSWILDHHLGQIDCYNIQFLGLSADIFLLLTFIKHHIETWLEQNYLKIIPFFSSISSIIIIIIVTIIIIIIIKAILKLEILLEFFCLKWAAGKMGH